MSNVANLVFLFVVAGAVVAGVLVIGSGLTNDAHMQTTLPSAASNTTNSSSVIVHTVGETMPGVLLPVLIAIAAMACIAAVAIATRRH